MLPTYHLAVTERARKLRAQYALQAQSLRTRIELRVNRIPKSLRKANMGELLEKYIEMSQPKQKGTVEATKAVKLGNEPIAPQSRIVISEDPVSVSDLRSRGTKRKRCAHLLDGLDLANLRSIAMQWNMQIRRIATNRRIQYLTPKGVSKPTRHSLVKSPTHLRSYPQNQQTRAPFLNRLFGLGSVRHKNPIYPILLHH